MVFFPCKHRLDADKAPVSPLTARKGLQVPTHRGRHKKARRSGLC